MRSNRADQPSQPRQNNPPSNPTAGAWAIFAGVLTVCVLTRFLILRQLWGDLPEAVGRFRVGVAFDLVVASIFGVYASLLIAARRFVPGVRALVLLPAALLMLFVVVDFGFYVYAGIHLTHSQWAYLSFGDVSKIRSSIFARLTDANILTALCAFALALFAQTKALAVSCAADPGSGRRLLKTAACFVILGLSVNVWANVAQTRYSLSRSWLSQNVVIADLTDAIRARHELVWQPASNTIQRLRSLVGIVDLPGERDDAYPWVHRACSLPAHSPATVQNRRRKNVLFIPLESFGALSVNPLSPNFHHVTPEIEALSREGTLFTRAYMNSIPTAPALASSLCSIYDSMGVARSYPDRALRCGPSVLKDHGYQTGFILGTDPSFDNKRGFYGQNGFSEIIGEKDFSFPPSHPDLTGQFGKYDDAELFRETLRWMDAKAKTGQPFFLTALTSSNHDPFPQYGPEFASTEGKGRRQVMQGTMRFVDHALGDFIRQMKKRDYYKDTIVFIFADHPSWFAESRENAPAYRDQFLNSWIPMLVLNPVGLPKGAKIDEVVSQVDLMPTVMDMLGICEIVPFVGQSWVNPSIPADQRSAFIFAGQFGKFLLAEKDLGLSWDPATGVSRYYDLSHHPALSVKLDASKIDAGRRAAIDEKLKLIHDLSRWAIAENRIWAPGLSL